MGREQEQTKFIVTLPAVVAMQGREMNLEPNDLEFFGLSHEKKDGSYVTDMSRELMVKARAEVSKKVKVLAVGIPEPMNHEKQSEIAREVMMELMGPNRPGRARFHGAGVTKSQVTKFAYDTRKVRGEAVTKENRFLSDKVNYQNKQIEMQSKQIEMQNKQIEMQSKQIEAQSKQLKIMEQKVDECTGELRVFRTAFQGTYNGSATWEGIP
ncbi:uncharacterized protein [Rutidosis leptorrhynchoides]|uniref:uncharacterized protein n=1 Tax=Rutidosis leptorrhynchoides TaxID=125765 RepID=UPI003A9A306A